MRCTINSWCERTDEHTVEQCSRAKTHYQRELAKMEADITAIEIAMVGAMLEDGISNVEPKIVACLAKWAYTNGVDVPSEPEGA